MFTIVQQFLQRLELSAKNISLYLLILVCSLSQFTLANAQDAQREKSLYESYYQYCAVGNMIACVSAGHMALTGRGTNKNPNNALNYFVQACNAKELSGCAALTVEYFTGDNVSTNYNQSLKYARKSCAKELMDEGGIGCAILGVFYFTGDYVAQNKSFAGILYKRSCKKHNGQACKYLANMYVAGDGVNKNLAEANHYASLGCKAGHLAACDLVMVNLTNTLKQSYTWNIEPTNASELLSVSKAACTQNKNPHGCYSVAMLYMLSGDRLTANTYFSTACTLGEQNACFQVGLDKREHVYSNTSQADALPYLEKACTGNVARSCHLLGKIYAKYNYRLDTSYTSNEVGVTKNDQTAVKFFTQACAAGFDQSCFNIGLSHFKGIGVSKNSSKAIQIFEKSCLENLNAGACVNVGQMYSLGLGVKKSQIKAKPYYEFACMGGFGYACDKA